jgi:hypothetical protein
MLLSFGGRAMNTAVRPADPDSLPIFDTAARGPRASLFHYSPALVVILIAIADAGRVTDPDLWGHVRFGQAALAARRLILHDPYSYTAPGHLWRNHEWLTEIMMALVYNALGVVGLKLWKFACTTATIVLLSLGTAETGATPGIQLNTLLVAAVALMPQMQFRPQIFTFALFAAMLLLLARHNYRGSAPLWLAIPIMALWSNVHGGFIMGLVALGVYTGIVALQDLIGGFGRARATRLAIITVAAALATLLTPYGIDTWYAVIHALRNPVTRNAVTDWQPLIFAITNQWHAGHAGVIFYLCGLGLMAAFAISFAAAPRGGDLPMAAIAAVMCAAAFVAMRNLPLALIASVGPIARHMSILSGGSLSFPSSGASGDSPGATEYADSDEGAQPARSGTNQWIVAALAAVVVVYTGLFSSRLREDMRYPAGAVAFMKDHHLHGNVLGDFGWGEYLIWHCSPQSKVFLDGRYDTAYPFRIIDDYIVFRFDYRHGAARILDAYPHDFVLIPPDFEAYGVILKSARWKLIYRDQDSALFARADSLAAKIPNIPVSGTVPKESYFPD